MKKIEYSFSSEDVKTFICTLGAMPLIHIDGVSDIQQSINNQCCSSAIEKFINSKNNFTPNEVRVMAVSLDLADAVLQGELEADLEVKQQLSQFIFSIKRLLPIFGGFFD